MTETNVSLLLVLLLLQHTHTHTEAFSNLTLIRLTLSALYYHWWGFVYTNAKPKYEALLKHSHAPLILNVKY